MVVCGTAGPVHNSTRYARNANGAITTISRYQGTRAAVVGMLANIPANVAFDFDDSEPPLATLTIINDGWGDDQEPDIPPQWELTGALSEKSIWEHWRTQAIPDAQKDAIRLELASKPRVLATGLGTDATTLREMLYDEQTQYACDSFIFSTTQLITGRRSVPIAYNNTNSLYSNAQLIRETACTQLYIDAINNAYNTVLNDFHNGQIRSGHRLSWLKHAPSIATVAGGRSSVRIEYWLSPWRTYTYPNSTSPT